MVLEREGNSAWLFMWAFWYVKGSHLHSLELSREGTAISRILQTRRQTLEGGVQLRDSSFRPSRDSSRCFPDSKLKQQKHPMLLNIFLPPSARG